MATFAASAGDDQARLGKGDQWRCQTLGVVLIKGKGAIIHGQGEQRRQEGTPGQPAVAFEVRRE